MKKLILLVTIAVVVAITTILRGPHPTTTSSEPAPPPAASTATPITIQTAPPTASPSTTGQGPLTTRPAARRAWEPIVRRFATAYPTTDGLTRRQWLANLRPYLHPDVAAALKLTELEQVPAGHYTGYRLLRAADKALTVRVTYQEGWSLVLDVAAESPGRYRIARLDLATEYDD